MVSIRTIQASDLTRVIHCNVHCLPENYNVRYWLWHVTGFPGISFLAEDAKGNVVGYVLAKIEFAGKDKKKCHGHITSVAVKRDWRKLGLATKLMRSVLRKMVEIYNATYCGLHVRATNVAAFHLYKHTLDFQIHVTEKGYYADGEDAYEMRKTLSRQLVGLPEEDEKAQAPGELADNAGEAAGGAVAAAGDGPAE